MTLTYSLPFLIFWLADPAPATQPDGWNRMQNMAPGESLEVLLEGSETVTGTLERVSPNGLTVKREGGTTQIAKWAIRRIWIVERRSRLKRVLLGAVIGFGGGCVLGATRAGYMTDMNNPPASTRAQVCAGIGAITGGVGAGVAAALPSNRRTLVFRAAERK